MLMFDRMNQVFAELSYGRTLEYLSSQQATQHMRMGRTFRNHQAGKDQEGSKKTFIFGQIKIVDLLMLRLVIQLSLGYWFGNC